MVGMFRRIKGRTLHHLGMPVGNIVDPLTFFVLDDLFLTLERGLGHRVDHVPEAVRIDPEDLFECVGRDDLVVDRHI